MNRPGIIALLLISLLFTARANDLTSESFLNKLQSETEMETQQRKLYAAVGNSYNIFVGNPLSSDDNGLKSIEVFTFNWADQITTSDKRFYVPKEFYVRDFLDCTAQASTESITGMTSYKKSLEQSCKFDASYNGLFYKVSFQGSVDYKNRNEAQSKNQTVSTFRKMQCRTYIVALNDNVHRVLSPQFQNFLKRAQANNAWEDFIDQYGTHYVSKAIYGAMIVEESVFSKSDADSLSSMGLDVSFGIKGSSPFFSGSLSSTTKISNEQKAAIEKVNSKTSTWVIGIPADSQDFNAWVDKVQHGKLMAHPISMSLSGIEELFETEYWPTGTTQQELKTMKDGFSAALIKIASKYPDVTPDVQLAKANNSGLGPATWTGVVTNGFYTIQSKTSKLYLEILGDQKDEGAPLTHNVKRDSDNQIFFFERITEDLNTYRIRNKKTGRFLEVANSNKDDGTLIRQWAYYSTVNQKFKIQLNGDGSVTIISIMTNKAIDLYAFSTTPGDKLVQWTNNGKDNQRYYLTRVNA